MEKKELKKFKKTEDFKLAYKIELETLEETFDKRDRVYRMLEDWKFKHGEIPTEYLGQWTAYLTDGRYLLKNKLVKGKKVPFTWRDIKGVYKKVKETAVMNAVTKLLKEKEKDGRNKDSKSDR